MTSSDDMRGHVWHHIIICETMRHHMTSHDITWGSHDIMWSSCDPRVTWGVTRCSKPDTTRQQQNLRPTMELLIASLVLGPSLKWKSTDRRVKQGWPGTWLVSCYTLTSQQCAQVLSQQLPHCDIMWQTANLRMIVRSRKAESISVCILSKAGAPSSRISSIAHLQQKQLDQTPLWQGEERNSFVPSLSYPQLSSLAVWKTEAKGEAFLPQIEGDSAFMPCSQEVKDVWLAQKSHHSVTVAWTQQTSRDLYYTFL